LFRLSLLAATLLLVAAVVPAHADAACAFESEPVVLMQEGGPHEIGSKLLHLWDVPDRPTLWSETAPEGGDYRGFLDELGERKIETDPVLLLERSPTENNQIVARNAGDWIRPATCLEMLMFGHQHGRLNVFENPSEFASIILRSPDRERLRVYYYTINHDGIGRMDPIVEPALEDRRGGWEVLIALHSHDFHPAQPELDGIRAPSEPDADFHVRFHAQSNMREARITNGVHTVIIPASSFDGFKRPVDDSEVSNPSE